MIQRKRNALIAFAASLSAVVVTLFGWQAWLQHQSRLEREVAESAQRVALTRGNGLVDQLVAEERAIETVRGDLVAASMARTAVAEVYPASGRMPASNAAAGLPDPVHYRGGSMYSLSVGEGGRIVMSFDATSGKEGGTIELLPDLAGVEAMGVEWHCTTADYAWIGRALPSCEFIAEQATGAPLESESPP